MGASATRGGIERVWTQLVALWGSLWKTSESPQETLQQDKGSFPCPGTERGRRELGNTGVQSTGVRVSTLPNHCPKGLTLDRKSRSQSFSRVPPRSHFGVCGPQPALDSPGAAPPSLALLIRQSAYPKVMGLPGAAGI